MKTNYANLDLLRALAVLSVVAAHLWRQGVAFHLFAYDLRIDLLQRNLSFTGVMFFFVHTCLVLMISMHRAPAARLGRSFLIRRAFRIYPLCWATIVLSLVTGLTDEPAGSFHVLGWPGVAVNVLLVHNIVRGYVSVIGPLWSLDWEVQMYLVLPLFFLVLRRFDRLIIVFGIWAGSALLAVAATQPAMPRAFHGAIFPPMFIGGMVAYKLLERQAAGPRRRALPAGGWPLFVLGLFALQVWLMGARSYESPQGAGLDAGICITLALAIPAFRELRAGWIVRPAQQIAKYSYSVYLLHIPALIFVLSYLPGLPLAMKVIVFLALTTVLSFISFHVIEDPLIRLGKRLAQRVQAPLISGSPEQIPSSVAPFALMATGSGPSMRGELGVCGQSSGTNSSFGGIEMKLSVLMSVYHKESSANLRQCLDSLAIQTLRADEVVIVEDGPLGEQLEATIAAYRKVLPIVSLPLPVHVGLGAALRAGLYMCRGEYVARMDSDDICVPERFQRQVKFLESNWEVDVVGGAIAEFVEDCSAPHSIRLLPAAGQALRRFAMSRTPMNHVTVVFRKASVVAAGNYESCQGFEDYHLWARMLTLGYRLHNMNDILVYVRCGNGMQSRRGGLAYLKGEIEFQSFLRKMGLLDATGAFLNILMRGPIRLAPDSVRSLCYSLFLRTPPAAIQRMLQ